MVLFQPMSTLRGFDYFNIYLSLFEQENLKNVSSATSVDHHPHEAFL
jgi:hypothetical protein